MVIYLKRHVLSKNKIIGLYVSNINSDPNTKFSMVSAIMKHVHGTKNENSIILIKIIVLKNEHK